jgi:hypothetical protein
MILTDKICTLSQKQIQVLNNSLFESCKMIMGQNKKVRVKTTARKSSRVMGYYDPETKDICMYRTNIDTVNEYVKTFIHEWQHSLQKKLKKKYARYDYKYGYKNNPYEIEARNSEKIYKSTVWKYAKLLIADEIC